MGRNTSLTRPLSRNTIGLHRALRDEVDDVSTLDLATLRDAPAPDAGDGLLLGVVRRHESLLALIDADALLAACQAAPLLEIA